RRRHTRSKRDWSSDVCSSDLDRFAYRTQQPQRGQVVTVCDISTPLHGGTDRGWCGVENGDAVFFHDLPPAAAMWGIRGALIDNQIGRASCRERAETADGGRTV